MDLSPPTYDSLFCWCLLESVNATQLTFIPSSESVLRRGEHIFISFKIGVKYFVNELVRLID